MNSSEIKSALYNHFRFKKQAHIMADEVSAFWGIADFLIINKNNIITEIEIKTSLADLKADFKKDKHRLIKDKKTANFYPRHYFYFCVPFELKKKALEIIENHSVNFGLLYVKENVNPYLKSFSVYSEKRAKILAKDIESKAIDNLKNKIIARLSSKTALMMREKYDISREKIS